MKAEAVAKLTARGESDETIVLRVPPSFRNRSEDFIQLVQHTTIRLIGAESAGRLEWDAFDLRLGDKAIESEMTAVNGVPSAA